jgi:hypothetical protein
MGHITHKMILVGAFENGFSRKNKMIDQRFFGVVLFKLLKQTCIKHYKANIHLFHSRSIAVGEGR